MKKGKVFIKGSTKNHAERIKKIVGATPSIGLTARIQKKSRLRVANKFVPKSTEEVEMSVYLVRTRMLGVDARRWMGLKKSSGLGRILETKINQMVVTEVSPKVRQLLVDRRLFLGQGSVTVVDYLEVVQWFRCYRFGHRSERCPSKEITCG